MSASGWCGRMRFGAECRRRPIADHDGWRKAGLPCNLTLVGGHQYRHAKPPRMRIPMTASESGELALTTQGGQSKFDTAILRAAPLVSRSQRLPRLLDVSSWPVAVSATLCRTQNEPSPSLPDAGVGCPATSVQASGLALGWRIWNIMWRDLNVTYAIELLDFLHPANFSRSIKRSLKCPIK